MTNQFYTKKSTKQVVFYSLLVIVALAGSFFAGFYFAGKNNVSTSFNILEGKVLNKDQVSNDVDFKMFWEVWNTIKRDYVDRDNLSEKKLFYGALQGLVASTKDPYSVFMNPEEAKSFEEDLSGTFEGIGAEIGFRNEILTIIAPIEGMPAVKAGILAGDKIYAIDGKTAAGMSVEDAVKKIRGPKGTKVTITVVRAKVDKPIDFSIVRDTVVVKSVTTSFNEKNKIFTVRISSFNNDSEDLFNQAVQEAVIKKPKGIIFDLRNNPGGYLETAVSVASEWVKEGPIVIEQFGDGKKVEHTAKGNPRLAGIPTVVLVNEGSASASEIVAGALKDDGLAKLVGQKTFGKGSVQVLRQLEDGSVVKITTAKWLTPKGTYINEQGIEPDTKVEISAEDREKNRDPQLDQALKILLP
ncbi:MAG: S41 family peptidase [Candidatus Falkowbacteria bacterium]|nr:S41 family peptidase [Candidatus Falkowbacteria bacterium]